MESDLNVDRFRRVESLFDAALELPEGERVAFVRRTCGEDADLAARVQLFADQVMPGVHTYVYLARATTIGSFVAAPTHVEQMYEPEVFGRTGAKTFVVQAK